jgi:carbon starvation protein
MFNNQLDAAVTGLFMILVVVVVGDAARVWLRTLRERQAALRTEATA